MAKAWQSQRITELEGEMADLEHRARQSDGEEPGRQLALLRAGLQLVPLADGFAKLRDRWTTWVKELDEDDWRVAYLAPRELAISARLRMVQINDFHITDLSPMRLRCICPATPPGCLRC
ncbi:hypothetical protein NDU88_005429 [Pleurodeles waltl]|uniref:Uncharacterized protein n=1 Tax=Pleurodeles waltl TaxID=8319 RepID=A0AAV7SLN9_PLEWA|nr:hypothetical protein NDU88_005429 [Pleurodeles waltl]